MAESDLISSTVSLSASQLAVTNFGAPAILSNGDNTASWGSTLIRAYATLAAVAGDFAKSTGTYLMAEQIFSQNPTVPLVYVILRATSNTTQTFFMDELGTTIGGAGVVLTFEVNGNSFSYTTVSGDATHDTFIGNLVIALTGASWYGASGLTITADTTNGAGHHLVKVVTTAGTINDIILGQAMRAYLILYQSQGVAGSGGSSTQTLLGSDLTNASLQNNNWYCVVSPFVSAIEGMAIAKWVQANTKICVLQTVDTAYVQLSASADLALAASTPAPTFPPVTSTFASLKALITNAAYSRAMSAFSQSVENFEDSAWAASKLWTNPGQEMWAYQTLLGVSAATLTETERNNVVGTLGAPGLAYGNVYENVGGVSITEMGITGNGQYMDTIRFLDWVNAQIQLTLLGMFIAASNAGTKIPYTQAGIAHVCAQVLGVLKQGTLPTNPGFAPGSCAVQIPTLASISTANLTARNLPDIQWSADLAGAIQTVSSQGNVTVQGTVTA